MERGDVSAEVREVMHKYGAVYFGALEGAAAVLAQCVKSAEVIAYEDLGAEAIWRLTVDAFPVIVINDVQGGDLYEEGRKRYQRWRGRPDNVERCN